MTEGLTLIAKKFMKSFQPLSSETIVSSAAPLSLYDTEEKGKIYPCAEMRITILTFSSYCIYVALPDISAFF